MVQAKQVLSVTSHLTARPTATGEKQRASVNHLPRPRVGAVVRPIGDDMSGVAETGDCARPVRRAPLLVCLGFILVYPLFSVPVLASFHNLVPRIGEIGARVVTEAAIWLYGAIVLALALVWETRTLASIGLHRFRFASLAFAIAGAVAMVGAGALAAYVVYGLLHRAPHSAPPPAPPLYGAAASPLSISVRAGVIEEIFFRGLAIEQLTVL